MLWSYILVSYASLMALGWLDNVRGPYFPAIIDDLSVSDVESSYFFALPSFMAFAGSAFCNRLIPRIGALACLRLGLMLMGIAFVLFGVAQSFSMVLFDTVLFGLGFGTVAVAQNVAIQEGSAPEWRRRLFSGLHSMYGFASLVAPLMASFFSWLEWSWRLSFMVASVVPLTVAVVSFWVKSPVTSKREAEDEAVKGLKPAPFLHGLYVALFVSAYMIGEVAISSRFVLYVRRTLDVSEGWAPLYLAGFFGLLFAGRITLFFLKMERLRSEAVMSVSLLSSIVFYVLGLWLSPWWLCLCGLTMAPFFPMAMDYISSLFGRASAQVISYTMAIGSLMVVFMHYSVGWLTELWGIQVALHLGPVTLSLVFLAFQLEPWLFKDSPVRK